MNKLSPLTTPFLTHMLTRALRAEGVDGRAVVGAANRAAEARAAVEVLKEEVGVASTTKAVMAAEAKAEEEAAVVAVEAEVRGMGVGCNSPMSVIRDALAIIRTTIMACMPLVLSKTWMQRTLTHLPSLVP